MASPDPDCPQEGEAVSAAERPWQLDLLIQEEMAWGRSHITHLARHTSKHISLYRQGNINYVLNREPESHAARFVAEHGPCAPAMAWRVVDARHALKRALDFGAT